MLTWHSLRTLQLVITGVNPANAAHTLKVYHVCASYIYVIDQVGAAAC